MIFYFRDLGTTKGENEEVWMRPVFGAMQELPQRSGFTTQLPQLTNAAMRRSGRCEADCVICLESMHPDDAVWTCARCDNPVHSSCFEEWRRHARRATCPVCRCGGRTDTGTDDTCCSIFLSLAAVGLAMKVSHV